MLGDGIGSGSVGVLGKCFECPHSFSCPFFTILPIPGAPSCSLMLWWGGAPCSGVGRWLENLWDRPQRACSPGWGGPGLQPVPAPSPHTLPTLLHLGIWRGSQKLMRKSVEVRVQAGTVTRVHSRGGEKEVGQAGLGRAAHCPPHPSPPHPSLPPGC